MIFQFTSAVYFCSFFAWNSIKKIIVVSVLVDYCTRKTILVSTFGVIILRILLLFTFSFFGSHHFTESLRNYFKP
jgi:hypothetical protein